MSKPVERREKPCGARLWEWRIFLRGLPPSLDRRLRIMADSTPFEEKVESDLYFLSPVTDGNVKIRKSNALKIKELLTTTHDGIELWQVRGVFPFPIAPSVLAKAAQVLSVHFPLIDDHSISVERLIEMAKLARPVLQIILVEKQRAQYYTPKAIVEVAKVRCHKHQLRSLCVEAQSLEHVRSTVTAFDLASLGRPMNYIQMLRKLSP